MQRKESINGYKLSYWLSWAMLGALSFLIMKIEIPVMPGFDYLKIDLSDSLVALSTLVFGPFGGSMIAVIKTLCNLALSGFNPISAVGNVAALLASLAYILPFYYISKKHSQKVVYQIGGLVVGTICLTIVMSLANYFVLMPMYITMMGFKLNSTLLMYILTVIVPFNLIKGVINSVIVVLLAKTCLPTIDRFVKKHF
ncbi:riboflavin transporter FmnP [Lactobacillus colini]|uniref:Riboflavin transporter n=1 Tax=Lactobacillus colini TaxID=1819254 RepID=A0ABS4ME65_9LACO|nr:ECF transporter S component [Lactobacillus colini]MBP2057982.1 riboflavin transporter FmnP [Lactobacillus colini]